MNQITMHHHQMAHQPHYASAFTWGIALNVGYVALEFLAGYLFNSLALVADAAHNLSDAAGLVLAWVAYILSQRLPTQKHTYGFGKATILASLLNSITLMFLVGAIAWVAAQRLLNVASAEPQSWAIMSVAACGIVVNGLTAYLLRNQAGAHHHHGADKTCVDKHDSKHDLNVRVAYMHMIADMLVSVGVVLVGVVLMFTGWAWLDPLASLAIAAVIFVTSWPLLVESWHMALDAVPEDVSYDDVEQFLYAQDGVVSLHDLHIWPLSTTQNALSVHIVRDKKWVDDNFTFTTAQSLRQQFNIAHTVIQTEHKQTLGETA